VRRVAAALCVATMLAATAFGATVWLKDGRKFEGEIVSKTDAEVKLKLASGKIETFKRADIKSIDEPIPPAPKATSNETGDATIDRRSREYERWLGTPLATATSDLTVVRGDHPVADLQRMADAAEKTARHFLATFQCKPEEAMPADRYGPMRVEIFQFWKEEGYVAFIDKALARIRDETVDDARLAFMKSQRGFWIMSPRALMAQYQGPGDLATSISNACHKTSHVLLAGWKPAGSFMPWWLYEGLASWQEFAVLGETRTYCLDLARPDGYSRPGTPEADEEAKAKTESGWREKVKALVGKRAEKELVALGKMSLNEIVLVDVQQSWSVVDWLFRTGKLKDFVAAYKESRDLNAACSKTLDAPASGAHEVWRQWVMKTY